MLDKALFLLNRAAPSVSVADAHCDGPCGVYDPSSARIAGTCLALFPRTQFVACRPRCCVSSIASAIR